MRSAPPAASDVALSTAFAVLLAALVLLALASAIDWLASRFDRGSVGIWAVALLLVWPLAGFLALHSRRPARRLNWDGQCWLLHSRSCPAEPGQPVLVLDAGAWLLVRWHVSRQDAPMRPTTRWLPLARSNSPAAGDWHALRTALIWAAP